MSCISVHFNDTFESIVNILLRINSVSSCACLRPTRQFLLSSVNANHSLNNYTTLFQGIIIYFYRFHPFLALRQLNNSYKKRHTNRWSDSLCNRQIFPQQTYHRGFLKSIINTIHFMPNIRSLILLSLCCSTTFLYNSYITLVIRSNCVITPFILVCNIIK